MMNESTLDRKPTVMLCLQAVLSWSLFFEYSLVRASVGRCVGFSVEYGPVGERLAVFWTVLSSAWYRKQPLSGLAWRGAHDKGELTL
mmetsp:Transcript_22877/g.45070  ORF Transcript_22877/g.45070 Transcript_22877/m.45070 type:complete len:87 (+) Transcript_22877:808-1068(+)